jgi:hypothetical protein
MPPNGHWYYRTDSQQRKCWYLRGADIAPSKQAPQPDARHAPTAKPVESEAAASPYSLASFKEFMAQRGGAKLSDQDVEELYTAFLKWNRRLKN